jgi:hypothetical protein
MIVSKMRIAFGAAALSVTLGFGALADHVRVQVVEPRAFIAGPEFNYDGGYYRTREGHYYHYDKDRSGWHYGRNHDEGDRWERRHHHEEHHDEHHEDRR